MRRLGEINPEDRAYSSCYEAYNTTLAPYHPWIIRKSATVAMNLLPTREQLLSKVCQQPTVAIETLPSMLDVTDQVYDRVQQLFDKYDLLNLP